MASSDVKSQPQRVMTNTQQLCELSAGSGPKSALMSSCAILRHRSPVTAWVPQVCKMQSSVQHSSSISTDRPKNNEVATGVCQRLFGRTHSLKEVDAHRQVDLRVPPIQVV